MYGFEFAIVFEINFRSLLTVAGDKAELNYNCCGEFSSVYVLCRLSAHKMGTIFKCIFKGRVSRNLCLFYIYNTTPTVSLIRILKIVKNFSSGQMLAVFEKMPQRQDKRQTISL
jgi:hypothetical protein